jgi:hypothetical protein
MLDLSEKMCFVIMPFKIELREVYSKAIKPACIKRGLRTVRVDEHKGEYNINRKIIEHVFASDIIISDLTGRNSSHHSAGQRCPRNLVSGDWKVHHRFVGVDDDLNNLTAMCTTCHMNARIYSKIRD